MNRRDIELLISARETTGRSFKQVTDNIDALNRKIQEQIGQAERGEISLQELRKSQEALAQAGRDLSAIQSQIDTYNRLAAQQEKVGASAEKAKNDLAALKATVEQAGQATAAQESKMQRLEVAVTKTSAAVERNATELAAQSKVLELAGVNVNQLDAAQANVVNSARAVGTGLVSVNAAITDYASNVGRAREAEQQLAAQKGFEQKISEAQRLGDAGRFVQLYAQAINTVAATDNQLAALNGFRAVGQQAVEASNDISRFVQSGQAMAVTSQEVAAGLRAIIDPGNAALSTLKGVEAQIEASDLAAAEGVKNVGALNAAYNDLSASAAALVRQGALVDTFRQQENATQLARAQFQQAQGDVQRLGAAMAAADAPTEALAKDLQLAETRLMETGRALTVEETKLGELSRALKRAGIDTNNLAASQARLEAAATRTAAAQTRINTTLGRGGQATNGLFGLKPNDLNNLGFQLNDIFVGLTSGQKPLTVFVQQGAQIAQIFPGIISGAAKMAARFFPLIAIFGGLAAVVTTYYGELARLKEFQDALAQSANGGIYDAQALADTSLALERLGASADDAKKSLMAFVAEGVDPTKINEYAEAAFNLSQRLGVDLAEATDLLVNIQKGGIEAVVALTEKTGDLTAADLEHAQALFDAGKAAEARQYILDRVAERNADIAHNTRSIWSPAVDNLRVAFGNLFSYLGKVAGPFLDWLNQKITDAAIGLNFITGLLAGKGFTQAGVDALAATRKKAVAPGASAQQVRDFQYRQELETEYRDTKKMTKEERLRAVAIDARRKAQAAGVSKSVEDLAVQKAITAETKKIGEEAAKAARKGAAASNRAEAARKRAQREAESAEKKRQAAQKELTGQLRQLDRAVAGGASAPLVDRLTAIDEKYESIYETIKKLRGMGLTTDASGTSLDEVEKQIEASKTRLKAEETIKFYQQQASLLEKQRADEVEKIQDQQERGAIGVQKAYEETAAINARLSPQITEAAQKALDVARGIAGATPSPEMVSMIAALERIVRGEATNNIAADIGLDTLETQSKKLDTLLKERDDLVRSYQTLNELGLLSDAEARQKTTQAYAAQSKAIEPVLTQLRQSVEYLHQQKDALTGLPVISDTAYATWLAKLDAVNAGLVNVDSRIAEVNMAAQNGIANGVANAFQTAADTIVGLVSGTMSWGDALDNVLTAGLSLLGSFLDAIAQVLVQMVALQAAKALIGGATGGFGGIFFHGGGKVGAGGGSRKKRSGGNGSWAGAPKFHGGGGLGLRSDEYKAVLQRGEEVLTSDDPRHIDNLGKGQPANDQGLRQVLLLDPDAVPSAMQSPSGVKSILTIIRANKPTIKQMLS